MDFGFLGLGAVMEVTGRNLTASPLFASGVLGASAVLLGGNHIVEPPAGCKWQNPDGI